MRIRSSFAAAAALSAMMMLFSVQAYAQSVSLKLGTDDKDEKKEEQKVVVEKVVEKSDTSVEQELRKIFGAKVETSLTGPRVENLGKFFLDKHTGDVSMIGYNKNEPVKWTIIRDQVQEDVIYEDQLVNYQLIKYGTGSNEIVLININTGVMGALEYRGLGLNEKFTRFTYLPAFFTEW